MLIHSHTTTAYSPVQRRRIGLLTWLATLNALFRARKTLGEMDARLLDDIGVTPTEARKEANRPFWDVPGHWVR